MIPPRIKKVLRDLWGNKGRTLLVVLAIAVGVFAFGSVFITQELLLKNIQDSYIASHPSDVTLSLSDFDESMVTWVKTQKDVSNAKGFSLQTVKLENNNKEILLSLIAHQNFSEINLDFLIPLRGVWPPGEGEIAMERNSYIGGKMNLGTYLHIKNLLDKSNDLLLTGEVYGNSVIPYIFSQQMTGYISWETLGNLGYSQKYNQLSIATTPNIKTLNDAENFTNNLTDLLKDRGVMVNGMRISTPGQHWATDNSKAFTAILSVIGTFSLILSAFLVVNTVSAILAQHRKQIGIMKAIGAKQKQVVQLYLLMVGTYGILALLIALPIAMILGYFFLKLIADFLNLDINLFYLPLNIFLIELAAALIIPLVSAIVPIIQSAKKSIRSAISDFQTSGKANAVSIFLTNLRGFSRPVLLSLRNVFRKSGRLFLTLGTLIVAGALFMSVINVRSAMYRELGRILSLYDFQVSISLAGDANIENIESRLKSIPNASMVEARNGVTAKRIKPNGSEGSDFHISGLPPDTSFSHPTVLSGRWLKRGGNNEIVLTSSFVRDNPDLTPGSDLYVEIGNYKYHFNVVGVISASSGNGGPQQIFADFSTISRIKDTPNLASSYFIKTNPADVQTQILVSNEANNVLERSGINVVFTETKNDIISGAANQFNFLIFFLLAMAVMVAVVGGLGLAGTMSLNVMERTREIGIMRSIGANDSAIEKLVLIEGSLVGLISFLLSIPISIPITFGFCYAIGNAFFGRTLVFTVVPIGWFIWFVIVSVIALIASYLPARSASRMSISETLSYE